MLEAFQSCGSSLWATRVTNCNFLIYYKLVLPILLHLSFVVVSMVLSFLFLILDVSFHIFHGYHIVCIWCPIFFSIDNLSSLFFIFIQCYKDRLSMNYDAVVVLSSCRYLSALISQYFLDIGSVSRILDSIIKLCLQLCRIIEQYEGTPNTTELEQITKVSLILFKGSISF